MVCMYVAEKSIIFYDYFIIYFYTLEDAFIGRIFRYPAVKGLWHLFVSNWLGDVCILKCFIVGVPIWLICTFSYREKVTSSIFTSFDFVFISMSNTLWTTDLVIDNRLAESPRIHRSFWQCSHTLCPKYKWLLRKIKWRKVNKKLHRSPAFIAF